MFALFVQGCFSLTTPDHVLRQRDQIRDKLGISVDISDASSFTGSPGKVLRDIERQLSPLPEGYRRKIGTIKVVDGMFSEYLLLSPFVGAYTDNQGTIFLRNANLTKFLQTVFIFPENDTLLHEAMHSVHFHEMKQWETSGAPSPEFRSFVKAWECQYFGDTNGDGEVDDRDITYIGAHSALFDVNHDGTVGHTDVELAVGNPYVQGRWASLRGMHVLLWMSLDWLAPRPSGFATPYAKTQVSEDAAETKRYAWNLALAPALYSNQVDENARKRAWSTFHALQRKDPLLARKVFLVVRYIAEHEDPARLSSEWRRYLAYQSGRSGAAVAE